MDVVVVVVTPHSAFVVICQHLVVIMNTDACQPFHSDVFSCMQVYKADELHCKREVDAVGCRHFSAHRQTSTQNLVRNVLPPAVLWISSCFQTHILTLQLLLRYHGSLEAKCTSTVTSRLSVLICSLTRIYDNLV